MGYRATNVNATTTATGTVSTTETTLGTFTLDSNQLSLPTDTIHIVAWGSVANNANVKTLTLYFGTATQAFVLPASAAVGWKLDCWIACISSTSQTGVAHMQAGVIASATADVFVLTMTQNTQNTVVVKTTGTATTSNDIIQKGLLVLA